VSVINEEGLQTLLDKQAIHDAMMKYCRGVDRCDEELMRSVYHEDAQDHHGPFTGPAWEFVAGFVPQSRSESSFTMHFIGNMTIELEGDRASSESYFVAYVGRREGENEYVDAFGGRYIDDWERRDNGWGVVTREVVHEWSRADACGLQPFPLPAELFAQPKRDAREDLSFRPPGELRG
jgi:hypothetical protein